MHNSPADRIWQPAKEVIMTLNEKRLYLLFLLYLYTYKNIFLANFAKAYSLSGRSMRLFFCAINARALLVGKFFSLSHSLSKPAVIFWFLVSLQSCGCVKFQAFGYLLSKFCESAYPSRVANAVSFSIEFGDIFIDLFCDAIALANVLHATGDFLRFFNESRSFQLSTTFNHFSVNDFLMKLAGQFAII